LRAACFVLAVVLAAGRVSSEERSPETVASAYFEGIKAGNWSAVALQFTPEAQLRFRSMMQEIIDAAVAGGQADIQEMLLGPGVTAEQAAKLSNRDFVARTLEALLGRAMGMMEFQRVDLVGRVAESPTLIHVLYRMHVAGVAGVTLEKMTVVSLERDAGGWGIGLSGDIKGLAAALKAQLAARPKG
jgi:hypothetical protein